MKVINWFNFLWLFIIFSLYSSVKPNKEKREVRSGHLIEKNHIAQQFEKKIATYIDELEYNFFYPQMAEETLHKIVLQIKQCTTLKQALVLLNKVDESLIKEHKEIECALFLQVLVVLQAYTNDILLDLLVIIDNHLCYWKEMNDYPCYYFFHKSPIKWFVGKNQQQEINNNIYFLLTLQQKYFKILGALTKQVQQFPVQATIDEQFDWIKKFITTMQVLYRREKDIISDEDHTVGIIKQIIVDALAYKSCASHYVNKLKSPHYFVRHWLKYAGLLLGIGVAYKNRKHINPWVGKKAKNKYKKSVCRIWQDYFINPLRGAYDIIITSEQKKLDIENSIQKQEELLARSEKLLTEKENELEKARENTREKKRAAIESIKKHLQQEFEAGCLTQEQQKKICQEAEKDNIIPFQQYVNNLPKRPEVSWTGNVKVVAAQPIWDLLQFILYDVGYKILDDFKSIFNHGHQELINVDESLLIFKKELIQELKRNQMTLRFTALIPAMVSGWGLYKITNKFYRWLKKQNFYPLKDILTQINAMLIVMRGDMDNEYYGNLIYSLYKLKCATLNHLTDKNIKREFLQNIEMLSLYEFTIEEKRLLIDNMRWKYDFLSPAYNQ